MSSRQTKGKPLTSLADLTPDPRNANKGTERGLGMLERSMQEAGAGRSIVADKDGRIIAGNKALQQWAADPHAKIRVVQTTGDELVVVQRTDLDLEDPTGLARKLAYYDNRTSEVGLSWDVEQLLADLQHGIDLDAFFFPEELAALLPTSPAVDAATPPATFPTYDENLPTDHTCPKCGYTWSGRT